MSFTVRDLIPPHNLDAERAVLGAVLLEGRGTLPKVIEVLKASDFYTEAHRDIYETMLRLFERGEPVDLIILSEELRRQGALERVGGPAALALLVEHASIAAHLPAYARIVRESGIKREAIRKATRITSLASSGVSLTEIETCVDDLVREVRRGNGATQGGAVLVRVADVQPEPVEWLWPGRLACGKLHLLIGNPGLGKSYLTLDAAARISRGTSWPDGAPAPVGNVVLLNAEDGVADTIRPRLEALDADLGRVHVLTAVRDGAVERGFSLVRDLGALERRIAETQAVLVVVDPASAYLGDRDSYKDAEVRSLLAPLAALAERQRVAVVGVMHLTKDQQRQAIHRALGSVAFVAAARVVLALAKDPEDEDRRVLASVKNNLTAPPPALAFKLVQAPGASVAGLAWESKAVEGVNADMLLSPCEPAEKREEHRAEAFLRDLLAGGDVKAREGEEAARAAGITPRTLDRARRKIGVRAYPVGFKPKEWWWSLAPKDATKATPKDAIPRDVASYGEGSAGKDEAARPFPKNATQVDMAPYGGGLQANSEALAIDVLDGEPSGPSGDDEEATWTAD